MLAQLSMPTQSYFSNMNHCVDGLSVFNSPPGSLADTVIPTWPATILHCITVPLSSTMTSTSL